MMVRSTPAVAAALVLALTGARLVAAACEMSCLYATDASAVTRVATSPSESAPHCHDVVESTDDSPGLVSSEYADACGQHATPVPFVLVSKSVASAHTLNSPEASRRRIGSHAMKLAPQNGGKIVSPVVLPALPLRI